jgi:pyridoxamine 5'-phosphate oxidase
MTLTTASSAYPPSPRTVLLKGVDERGFVFYTNEHSRKGRELAANPHAALVFRWHVIDRQVIVTGAVARVSDAESDAYFASRPVGSRLGAWASEQSTVVADRGVLERRLAEVRTRFGDDVPRPPHWGGFRVAPEAVEFWHDRSDRLHDRLRFRRASAGWELERLAP